MALLLGGTATGLWQRTFRPIVAVSLGTVVLYALAFRQGSSIHDYWNYWLLLPLALVLLALRQLLKQGDLQATPWHALLWYSYNLFYQFHPEMRNPPSG